MGNAGYHNYALFSLNKRHCVGNFLSVENNVGILTIRNSECTRTRNLTADIIIVSDHDMRMRHVELATLFNQSIVKSRTLLLSAVRTKDDSFTRYR